MSDETITETTESGLTNVRPAEGEQTTDTPDGSSTDETESETFPREVVEKLRQENGKYRQRAQQADTLAQGLAKARASLDSGAALRALETLVKTSQEQTR